MILNENEDVLATKPKKGRLIGIDADYIPYRVANVEQEDFYNCIKIVDSMIRKLSFALDSTNFALFLTGRNNYRKLIREDYKLKRKDIKHLTIGKFHKSVIDYLVSEYKANYTSGYEADDALSLLANSFDNKDDLVIVSPDVDLLQIEGTNYNPNTGLITKVEGLGEFELCVKDNKQKKIRATGDYLIASQIIMGDKDECDGLDRFGTVKTYTELKDCKTKEDLYTKVIDLYLKHSDLDSLVKNTHLIRTLTNLDELKDIQEYYGLSINIEPTFTYKSVNLYQPKQSSRGFHRPLI